MIVKNIKKICAVIIILIFISVSTFLIDSCLAEDNKSPIFSFPYAHINDGGSVCYLGLGYQIIKWKTYSEDLKFYNVGVEKHYIFGINLYPENPNIPLLKEKIYKEAFL